jgi:arylsulfatase
VILKIGGHVGGWSFYFKDGCPTYCYNLFGINRSYVRGKRSVPAGEHQVRMEFAYAGGGIGKGGTVTLYIDGKEAGSGLIEHTEPIGFGSVYSDVGRDSPPQVTDEYPSRDNGFTGSIKWVQLEAGEDSHDHLVPPENFVRMAMAKQ